MKVWAPRLIGALIVACAALASAQLSETDNDDHGAHARELVVGINRDYPPYEYVDAGGEIVGFDVDIVRAAAEASGLKVRFVTGVWSDRRVSLESGEIDMLAGMLYSDERAGRVSFSRPYLSVHYAGFVRADDEPITDVGHLESRRVLVENDSLVHDRLSDMGFVEQFIPVASEPEALRRVAAGEGDVAVVPLLTGRMLIADESLVGLRSDVPPLWDSHLCIASTLGRADLQRHLNEGLAMIRHDGTYDAIYDKWFGVLNPRPHALQPYVSAAFWFAAAVVVLLIATMLWSWSLRRQVRSRTEALEVELVDRNAAETKLRESEHRYRDLVESSEAIIGEVDWPSSRFVFVSPVAESMLGYPVSRWLEEPDFWANILHPDDRERALNYCMRASADGKDHRFEYRMIAADGSVVWIDDIVRVMRDEGTGRKYLRTMMVDMTERKLAEQRQRALMRELDHRVKNNLAAVLAIVSATAKEAPDVTQFKVALDGRVGAMARTHEALARTHGRMVNLSELARVVLDPFMTTAEHRIEVAGPSFDVPGRTAQPLAMVLHELATNAAKHGALSVPEGRVRVHWRVENGKVKLHWSEHDGPKVTAPQEDGFGMGMIRDMIAYEVGGEVRLDFGPQGVQCDMLLPLTLEATDGESGFDAQQRRDG